MPKISLNLPDETLAAVRELARKRNVTVTHVIRQAVESEAFLDREVSSGAKLLIESQDKRIREVVFK